MFGDLPLLFIIMEQSIIVRQLWTIPLSLSQTSMLSPPLQRFKYTLICNGMVLIWWIVMAYLKSATFVIAWIQLTLSNKIFVTDTICIWIAPLSLFVWHQIFEIISAFLYVSNTIHVRLWRYKDVNKLYMFDYDYIKMECDLRFVYPSILNLFNTHPNRSIFSKTCREAYNSIVCHGSSLAKWNKKGWEWANPTLLLDWGPWPQGQFLRAMGRQFHLETMASLVHG